MKIKNFAIIILMTIFLIIFGNKTEATTGKINSETVRLRKEPNTTSTILEQLDKNDEVEILEQEEGWYKVKVKTSNGTTTGYISEKLVDVEKNDTSSSQGNEKESENEENSSNVEEPKETQQEEQPIETLTETPAETSTEVPETNEAISTDVVETTEADVSKNIEENNEYTIKQEVSIKAVPLINSIEKSKITGNIKVVEIINDWARIENDVEDGWIRKNKLKDSLIQIETQSQQETEQEGQQQEEQTVETTSEENKVEEPKEEEKEPEITELNKTGYVKAEGLKVRKEPNTTSEELDSLKKNDKVEIIGQTGNWYQIKINGGTGYVSAKYISDTKVAETTSRSGNTLKNSTTTTVKETEQKTETPATTATTATTSTAISTQSASGTTGTAVVSYAKQYLGCKYVSGGSSPSTGFDCSGFTTYVYKHFGISLNRSSRDQIKNGIAVAKSDLQPGDIVIFNNSGNTSIGHVGIYIGNGNFIHAANSREGVVITSLSSSYYQKRYVGARRVI